jgi:16S rRNA (adenine1518-N6/adenine1519-N6)-dimethyltransferase
MPPARLPGPRPRKSLGQHFLRDSGVLLDIARAVHWPDGGCVIEIGPGTGQLTELLLAEGRPLVALEIEPRMIEHLRRRFRSRGNLRLVEGDARTIDVGALLADFPTYSVVGNLPYFAANPIIRHFLEASPKPEDMVVMVQREVAREIAAKAGDWSLLTISVHVYAQPELLFDVPPEAFDPPPNVWSSVMRLTLRPEPLVPDKRNTEFFEFVSKVFRNPRKQIHNSLSRGVWLPPDGARDALLRAGIDPARRPETLDIADWLRLMDACDEVRASA